MRLAESFRQALPYVPFAEGNNVFLTLKYDIAIENYAAVLTNIQAAGVELMLDFCDYFGIPFVMLDYFQDELKYLGSNVIYSDMSCVYSLKNIKPFVDMAKAIYPDFELELLESLVLKVASAYRVPISHLFQLTIAYTHAMMGLNTLTHEQCPDCVPVREYSMANNIHVHNVQKATGSLVNQLGVKLRTIDLDFLMYYKNSVPVIIDFGEGQKHSPASFKFYDMLANELGADVWYDVNFINDQIIATTYGHGKENPLREYCRKNKIKYSDKAVLSFNQLVKFGKYIMGVGNAKR